MLAEHMPSAARSCREQLAVGDAVPSRPRHATTPPRTDMEESEDATHHTRSACMSIPHAQGSEHRNRFLSDWLQLNPVL